MLEVSLNYNAQKDFFLHLITLQNTHIMKKTFYYLLLLLPLLGLGGCNDDDNNTPTNPVDLLPSATQTGANTFGCLVNGEPFVATNTSLLTAIYQGGILQLGAYYETNNQDQGIIVWLDTEIEVGMTYVLNENVSNIAFFKDYMSGCTDYQTFAPNLGTITITSFNQNQYIISGTFEFQVSSPTCQENITITNGRFDLKYIP